MRCWHPGPPNRSSSTSTCPICPSIELRGWRHASIGLLPPRAVTKARLEPVEGREGAFAVRLEWGDTIELPPETDGGAIERDEVTISYVSRLVAEPRADLDAVDEALDGSLAPAASYDVTS